MFTYKQIYKFKQNRDAKILSEILSQSLSHMESIILTIGQNICLMEPDHWEQRNVIPLV